MALRLGAFLLAALALPIAACGKKEVTVGAAAPAAHPADAPAAPPAGWVTHENLRAGFTIALPRDWEARASITGSRLSSADGTLVVSLQADRSEDGQTTPAAEYALSTLEALPGYRELAARTADPPASPYEAGRAAGTGRREQGGRDQHVAVTALRAPGFVTYAAVAFSDPRSAVERRTLDRALTTLRARPGAG